MKTEATRKSSFARQPEDQGCRFIAIGAIVVLLLVLLSSARMASTRTYQSGIQITNGGHTP